LIPVHSQMKEQSGSAATSARMVPLNAAAFTDRKFERHCRFVDKPLATRQE